MAATAAEGRLGGRLLDLDAIAEAVRALAADPPAEWTRLLEPPSPDAARWMIDAYMLLDDMLARGDDPFRLGGSRLLLDLNNRVLCGKDPTRRREFLTHLAETESRYYDDREAGADAFYDWASRAVSAEPIRAASALYVRIVSAPQLFVEGNQRTAALAASVPLVRGGLPPMVATRANAAALARISAKACAIRRDAWTAPFDVAIVERRLRAHLARTLDPVFLLQTAAAAPG